MMAKVSKIKYFCSTIIYFWVFFAQYLLIYWWKNLLKKRKIQSRNGIRAPYRNQYKAAPELAPKDLKQPITTSTAKDLVQIIYILLNIYFKTHYSPLLSRISNCILRKWNDVFEIPWGANLHLQEDVECVDGVED